MISLSLRLMVRGGREAVLRLVVIAVAVTLGVAMLLVAFAGINAVNSQNHRYAWLNAAYAPRSSQPVAGVAPLWWQLHGDYFQGIEMARADVAPSGPNSPVPPGIPRLPKPGEYYASPRLARLLATVPAAELAARYPGHLVGTIADSALPAPDSMIIVVGYSAAQLASVRDVDQVSSFQYAQPGGCNCYAIGINPDGLDLILGVVAGAILFPVLIFIGAASRLSAARRELRFAALRLVGATPRQVALIAAVESTVAAVIGVVAGFALFYALRPAVATIAFTGDRFFTSDLSLSLVDVLVVALGVPLAAAVVSRVALRRVQASPLGVSRRTTPAPPRPYRLLLLLAGIVELAVVSRPPTATGQTLVYLAGMLLMMSGLVVAGPWLTLVGSRVMARRTHRASVLLAARRLSDNPQAAFRAISGLVLALFVTTVAVGSITTWNANRAGPRTTAVAHATVIEDFSNYGSGQGEGTVPSVPATVVKELLAVKGVSAVTLTHVDPAEQAGQRAGSFPGYLAACGDLAGTPALGRCAPGSSVALIPLNFDRVSTHTIWPSATVPLARMSTLPVVQIVVATDGSRAAVEQARTVLGHEYDTPVGPQTLAELETSPLNVEYQQLADMVLLVSLPIAGCTLAASVAGGLNDRRRPFSLLRLAGAQLSVLRRVVLLESVVPLLVSAVVAVAAGFLATELFVRSQLQYTLTPPGIGYWVIVLSGLVVSLLVLASTLPILTRISGPESARSD